MQIFPKKTRETLTVNNFLALTDASIEITEITALIGPQASGKSILAKLVYYFRGYISDLFVEFVPSDEDRRKFNKRKSEEFQTLFPGSDLDKYSYSISYTFGDVEIGLDKKKANRGIKISVSQNLVALANRTKSGYRKYLQSEKGSARYMDDSIFGYVRADKSIDRLFDSLPRALHVPASRAFFSSIQSNVFTFLSESQSLDPIFIQFGRFFEFSKRHYDYDYPSRLRQRRSKTRKPFSSVIGGEYKREKQKDIIETAWGRVNLQNSSSGQQEALPLLLAIEEYPSPAWVNDMLIIEEPEAHLYPKAQKEVLERIVDSVVENKCDVLITTHSPYMLACINNQIRIRRRDDDLDLRVSAYFVDNGQAANIFSSEDQLIDLDGIDSVSQEIADEFVGSLD